MGSEGDRTAVIIIAEFAFPTQTEMGPRGPKYVSHFTQTNTQYTHADTDVDTHTHTCLQEHTTAPTQNADAPPVTAAAAAAPVNPRRH